MNRFHNRMVVFLSLLILVAHPSFAKRDKNVSGSKVDLSNVITVIVSKSGNILNLGGTIIPRKQVSLSAELPGRISYLAGKVGDKFDKGTVIVQIDDTELLAKRQEILVQVDIANTNIRNARVQYERAIRSPDYNPMMGRMSTMFGKFPMDAFSSGNKEVERYANVYSYQAQLEQARAGLLQTEAKLRQLNSKLRNTRAITPFSGTIVRKNIEVGDTVQPGMQLVAFADLEHLQMMIDVPSRLVSGLSTGVLLPARVDSNNIRMEVEVAQIYPMADIQKHTIKVKLNLPKGIPVSPGTYAEVSIPDQSKHVVSYPVVPRSALMWRGALPAVFLVNDDDETELRLVRIGKHMGPNNAYVQVLSGIKIGDRIVTKPKARGWGRNQLEDL